MENTLKPNMPLTDFAPFLNEDKSKPSYADSIKRIMVLRNETKKARKDIEMEALANLLIDLS